MQTPPLVPGQQKQAPIKEKAIEYAKGAQEFVKSVADKLPELKTYEQNLINILGEEVAFAPTGINKSFKQIVEFDDYYKPAGISDDDFIILKNTMRILFENRFRKILDVETGDEEEGIYVLEHFPPCDEHEKELVLKSLIHRKNLLLGQLKQLGIKSYEEIRQELRLITEKDRELQGKESLTSRQYLLHYYHLQKFIDAYNTYAKCVSTDEKAYKGVKIDLDDDKIRELLKQYVFFILQGKNPLEDFKKTDPTSSQFIARLAKKPLGEKFPTFMDKYKKEQFPIPEPIAKILDSTELSPGAMKAAVDQQIIVRIKEIVKFINNLIPPNHPFRKRFPDLDKVTDLKAVLDELWKLLRDCEENQKTLQTQLLKQKEDLENRIKTCEQGKAALEIQKRKYEQDIRNLQGLLSFHTNQEAKIVDLNNQITALNETVKQRQEQINKLNADIANLRQQQTLLQTRIDELTRENQALTQQVTDKDNTITQLRQDIATRDGTITQLTQEGQTKDNTITRLTQEGQTKQTTIEALQREVEQLRNIVNAEIEPLRKQLDEARDRITAAETAKQAAEEARQKIQDDFTSQQAELRQAQSDLQTQITKVNTCEGEKAEIQRLLNEATSALASKEKELLDAKKETTATKAQLTTGTTTVAALQEQITKLNQDIQQGLTNQEALENQVNTLKQQLLEQQTKNQELEAQVKACKDNEQILSQGTDAIRQKVTDLSTQLGTLQGERDAARSDVQRLQTEIERMKVALNDAQEQMKKQGITIQDLTSQIKIKNVKIEAEGRRANEAEQRVEEEEQKRIEIQQSKDKIVEELSTIHKRSIEEMQAMHDETRAELEEALKQRDEAIDSATKAKEEKRKCDEALKQLQGQLSSVSQKAGLSEQERKKMEQEINNLKISAQNATAEVAKANAALETANKREEEANARVNNLTNQLQQIVKERDEALAIAEQRGKERDEALATAEQRGKERNAAIVEKDYALATAKRTGEELMKIKVSAQQLAQERGVAITKADQLAADLLKTGIERDEALASAEQAKQERNDAIQSAEEIRKINEEYEGFKKIVHEIAVSQDPTSLEINLKENKEEDLDLKTIIDRLQTAVIPTSVTKQIEEKKAITSMQCYYIFLLTFLWRTNFPRLILPSAVKDNYYNWENTTYNMFESVFNKAPNPTLISVAASSSTEQKTQEDRSYILGLYKTYKKSREIMSEYLRIFRILEMNLQYAVYKPSDFDRKQPIELPDNKYIQYVKDLIEKINFISNSYKQAKKLLKRPTGSFQQRVNSFLTELNADQDTFLLTESTSMAESATDYMIAHQPDIDKNIFKYTIIVENNTIKIGTTGNLNYAVLFYLFLFVSRDYFNLIENSGLCQLPRFLKTQ